MKTTVLVFHPNWDQSRVNKTLVSGLDQQIEVRNMYNCILISRLMLKRSTTFLKQQIGLFYSFQCTGIVHRPY